MFAGGVVLGGTGDIEGRRTLEVDHVKHLVGRVLCPHYLYESHRLLFKLYSLPRPVLYTYTVIDIITACKLHILSDSNYRTPCTHNKQAAWCVLYGVRYRQASSDLSTTFVHVFWSVETSM